MPTIREKHPIPSELPIGDREAIRRLPLDGAHNFRDIGGYAAEDGRTIRWGLLYRSDHLGKLSSRDERYLGRLGIRKVTDFRGPLERKDRPNRIPDGMSHVIRSIDVAGAEMRDQFEAYVRGKIDIDPKAYLHEVNRLFATEYTSVYREWIRDILDDPGALPQVFHCTAGKDRTGFAAAVLMRILGVPRETVINDYLKTNTYVSGRNERLVCRIRVMSLFRIDKETIRSLFGVDRVYLETAFATLDEHWGDFESYVKNGLELSSEDIGKLKELLLE